MKAIKYIVPLVVIVMLFTAYGQEASVEIPGQIDAGGPITLHLKVDKPLPPGARIRVEISPQGVTQWIALSTEDPVDSDRTSFTLKSQLPANAVPGTWVVRNVFLFLPESIQGQPIAHNNATFQVKGREFPIPSKAEIAITK